MKKTQLIGIQLCVIALVIFGCQTEPSRNLYPKTLNEGFNLLSAEQTGIDFQNNITESTYLNHFYFGHLFIGSGVAIGDINNDGKPDLFFGGNQVNDKLYLNKGGFKFEDITKPSKISQNSGWTWGVTMADVNADGYLDIYVSRNGYSIDKADRRNLLYINNQDLTFTESAIQYGLADVGFSTQAVFFDMDNDGDLDMYQVNQLADKKLLLQNKIPKSQFKYFRDRMYRNDEGKFKDVSDQVGISKDVAYGLSVNASDFNHDGWVDLYVANDYAEPDFMYFNNGDGTFTNVINEQLQHITQLSMGSDTGDINNDGYIDLITTDMTPEDHYRSKTNMASMSTDQFNAYVKAGAHYQYMANTLQINTGMGGFSDVGHMAGIAYTDWSWASLMADLDNDGFKDIIVSNGIKRDIDNNDFRQKIQNLEQNTTPEALFEISQNTPSRPIANYAFKNKGNLIFEKVTQKWGFGTPSFSNGMAYGDLDSDGDLDIVVNNIDAFAFVYDNQATGNFLKINLEGSQNNRFGIGAKAIIHYDSKKQIIENTVTRGFLSSVQNGMFFGLGKQTVVDSVEVIWPNGKVNILEQVNANQAITVAIADAKNRLEVKPQSNAVLDKLNADTLGIDFLHIENEFDEYSEEILLPHNVSQNGPYSAIGDVNNDGLEDVFIGGAVGQSGTLYIRQDTGNYIKSTSRPWANDQASEDLGCLFIDVDNDDDLDLYIASGGTEYARGHKLLKDRLYINNGFGSFSKANTLLPDIRESSQVVKASDIDADGDLDLFVGIRVLSKSYAHPATSYLLINHGGTFSVASEERAPALKDLGMVTDAVFTDIDNDNDEDLMIVGEWMEIKVLINNSRGNFKDGSDTLGMGNTRGLWWSITASDLDNDGDEDYILGNLGKNNKFKASKEHPFKLYVNDFDNNGTNDIVLAKFYKENYVPVRGRECTSQQMPYVANKFKDYHSFASSKLIDILPDHKMDDALVYEIESFESVILRNDNGHLVKEVLPNAVQISPIKASLVTDINNDGYRDIVIVGNHYGVEVETTRYDAGYGAVLLGNKDYTFTYMPAKESGFYVPFDSRNIQLIKDVTGRVLLVTNNNSKSSLFRLQN